ncbi:MAG TPA: nitrous oxide reductase accessory protein NosL [Longimicrobium sp.]
MRPTLLRISISLALAACATADAAPRPREIAYGVDACEQCHMSVDDPGLAAEWLEPGGAAHKFDQPGCLVAWLAKHPVDGTGFVRDYGGGWVRADSATYVIGGRRTDMGFSVTAFRARSAADARAAEIHGRTLDWTTLKKEGVPDAHAH